MHAWEKACRDYDVVDHGPPSVPVPEEPTDARESSEPTIKPPTCPTLPSPFTHANDPQCAEGKDGLAMVGALGKASSIWQNSSVIKSGMCVGFFAAKCCQPAGCKNSMTNSTFSETRFC